MSILIKNYKKRYLFSWPMNQTCLYYYYVVTMYQLPSHAHCMRIARTLHSYCTNITHTLHAEQEWMFRPLFFCKYVVSAFGWDSHYAYEEEWCNTNTDQGRVLESFYVISIWIIYVCNVWKRQENARHFLFVMSECAN